VSAEQHPPDRAGVVVCLEGTLSPCVDSWHVTSCLTVEFMIGTWQRPASSQIAFALLLGGCVTLILRPAELIPELLELPIYEGFIVGSLLFGHRALQRHFMWRNLPQQPATLCMIGALVAIIVSHFSQFSTCVAAARAI